MKYMVGNPADIEKAWKVVKPYLSPRAAGIEGKAMHDNPLKDWWAPPGTARYLIVQGTNDQAAPPENGVLLKKELGDRVTLKEIPGAGHLALVTQPQQVADDVLRQSKEPGL